MKKAKKVSKKAVVIKKDGPSITPLGDRVLVKEIKETAMETVSGIIIPETVNEDKGAKKGKVVAVGEGHYVDGKLVAVSVKVGQTVLYQWGDVLKIDSEEYTLVNESSVLAVIK